MSVARDMIGRKRWAVRRPGDDGQGGQVILEYTLLLATFGIPMIYLARLLLGILAAQYAMVTCLETLPLP
jgi:hypothetical protein